MLELQIKSLLERELNCLERLRAILIEEHKALLSADLDALGNATADKNAALANQAEATRARQGLTAGSASDSALIDLIASCENHVQLNESLSKLDYLAKQCHTQNRDNGRLIMQKQKQAKSALDIIRQTESTTSTYSGYGKATDTSTTRSLGKA
jgi:flagellar biosynthesis/type III secretory pathway chaperone